MNVFARALQAIDDIVDRLECYPPQPVDEYQTAPVVYRQSSVLDPVQERQDAMARLAYRQVVALEEIAKELKTLNARPAPAQPAPIIIQQPASSTPPRVQTVWMGPKPTASNPINELRYDQDGYVLGYKCLKLIESTHTRYFVSQNYMSAVWHGNCLTADGQIPAAGSYNDLGHGIYFFKHFSDPGIEPYRLWPGSRLIQARCWGDFLETVHGFRAQHAEIVQVLDPISNEWQPPLPTKGA